MQNPIHSMLAMSRGGQLVLLLGSGAGVATIFMAIVNHGLAWKVAAGGFLVVGLLILLYKVGMILWQKKKSGPFAAMLSRKGGGGGSISPAQKANMDSLRSKFEEGVKTFSAAGKDIYALPWYLVVGPPGSGKTEMVRRSEVGFPPGLQDVLQGAGGTFNMNWWFTNHAVMLDTAGRMFMEESGEGNSTEWKEFLKLLKTARPNCPINGVILVLPAESVLEDKKETIESYAMTISRQLDTIQRTLEVRFPVTVVISKCDKVVGFEQFFRNVNNGDLQHQMMGWSNPDSLDKSFSPDEVEKHLEVVRQKLVKRRAGLLQNPVHTTDPNGRRSDEVDELFELPAKLMSMIPRLRQYLDKIFVASEWSPKPLFLRGIYFTSSMRQGEALDAALAAALGTTGDDPAMAKRVSREKSFFLRDMFLGKIFKEKGLVTNAANVGKAMASRRRLVVGTAVICSLLVGGVTALSIWGYRDSFSKPAKVWASAADAVEKDDKALQLFELKPDNTVVYLGREPQKNKDGAPTLSVLDVDTPRLKIYSTTADNTQRIVDPLIAKPMLSALGRTGQYFETRQLAAQRALVEANILKPLIDGTRQKLKSEKEWGSPAIGALAQLVRLTTLSEGAKPKVGEKSGLADGAAIEVKPLIDYTMGGAFKDELIKTMSEEEIAQELNSIQSAVNKAYGSDGYPKRADGVSVSDSLLRNQPDAVFKELTDSVRRMRDALARNESPSTDLGRLGASVEALSRFSTVEKSYEGSLAWLAPTGDGAGIARAMETIEAYKEFSASHKKKVESLKVEAAASDSRLADLEAQLGAGLKAKIDSPDELLAAMKLEFVKQAEVIVDSLTNQLPDPVAKATATAKLTELSELFTPQVAKEGKDAKDLEGVLAAIKKGADVAEAGLRDRLKEVGPLMVRPSPKVGQAKEAQSRLYLILLSMHEQAQNALEYAEKFPGASAASTAGPAAVSAAFTSLAAQAETERASRSAPVKEPKDFLVGSLAATRYSQSVQSVSRAFDIVKPRALHGLIDAALKEPIWTAKAELAAAVDELSKDPQVPAASKRIAAVPLSIIETDKTKQTASGKFVARPAALIAGTWVEILRLTDLPKEKSEVVGTGGLKQRPERTAGGEVFLRYVEDYAAYWSEVALKLVLPRESLNLSEVASLDTTDLGDQLKAVKKTSFEALDSMEKVVGERVKSVAVAKKDVDDRYRFLDDEDQAKKFTSVLGMWKNRAAQPNTAKNILRDAVTNGGFSEQYAAGFAGLRKDRTRSYQDELIARTLLLLAKEGGGIGEVFGRIQTNYKAIPLAAGAGGDLTLDDVKRASEDIDKVVGAAPGGADGGPLEQKIANAELRDLVMPVIGEDFAKGPARRKWLASVKAVAQSLRAPFKARVAISDRTDAPAPGIKHANTAFVFAGVAIGGAAPANFVNLMAAAIVPLELEIPSANKVQINLYPGPENPNPGAKPGAQINLSVNSWGVLGLLLAKDGLVPAVDAAGSYEVAAISDCGKYCVWLKVTLPSSLPKLADWPTASGWAPPN